MTKRTLKRDLVVLGAAALAALSLGAARADERALFEEGKRQFVERLVSAHGFERAAVESLLATATLDKRVLDAISRPAERVVPWHEYREIFVTPQRIEAGVEFWRRHAADVDAAARRYGVPAEMIVAIIGVETFFGQRMGNYRVLDSLATLAFAYPPRARFFAGELEALFLLTREEGDHLLDAKSSYAGAMGAGQFIPSSFRAYAVDANGDGRRDLWNDWQDVLGSVANYFKVHGWREHEPVGAPATLAPGASPPAPANRLELTETVGSLERLGYRFAATLPDDAPAAVFALESADGGTEYWVGYHNFHVITRYNRSHKYALAAHQLGQAIRDAYRPSGGSAQ